MFLLRYLTRVKVTLPFNPRFSFFLAYRHHSHIYFSSSVQTSTQNHRAHLLSTLPLKLWSQVGLNILSPKTQGIIPALKATVSSSPLVWACPASAGQVSLVKKYQHTSDLLTHGLVCVHLTLIRLQPLKYTQKIKGQFSATSGFVQEMQHLEVLPSTPVYGRKMPEIWEKVHEHRVCNITSSSSRDEAGRGPKAGGRS